MLQNEYLFAKSVSMQPRTSPDKFAVRLGLASPDLGSFLSLLQIWVFKSLSHQSKLERTLKSAGVRLESSGEKLGGD